MESLVFFVVIFALICTAKGIENDNLSLKNTLMDEIDEDFGKTQSEYEKFPLIDEDGENFQKSSQLGFEILALVKTNKSGMIFDDINVRVFMQLPKNISHKNEFSIVFNKTTFHKLFTNRILIELDDLDTESTKGENITKPEGGFKNDENTKNETHTEDALDFFNFDGGAQNFEMSGDAILITDNYTALMSFDILPVLDENLGNINISHILRKITESSCNNRNIDNVDMTQNLDLDLQTNQLENENFQQVVFTGDAPFVTEEFHSLVYVNLTMLPTFEDIRENDSDLEKILDKKLQVEKMIMEFIDQTSVLYEEPDEFSLDAWFIKTDLRKLECDEKREETLEVRLTNDEIFIKNENVVPIEAVLI